MSTDKTTLTFTPSAGYQIGDIVMCPAYPPTRWERIKHWWHGTKPQEQVAYRVVSSSTAEPVQMSEPDTMERAKAARDKLIKQVKWPPCNGVGIGKVNGTLGIRGMLSTETDEPLPSEIDGFPVEWTVVGTIRAQGA